MNFKRHTSAFKNLPGPLLWVLQFYNLIISSQICRGEWRGGSPSPVICFSPQLHVSDILCGLQAGLSLYYCVPGSHRQKTEKKETNTRECPPSPVTTLCIPSCGFLPHCDPATVFSAGVNQFYSHSRTHHLLYCFIHFKGCFQGRETQSMLICHLVRIILFLELFSGYLNGQPSPAISSSVISDLGKKKKGAFTILTMVAHG